MSIAHLTALETLVPGLAPSRAPALTARLAAALRAERARRQAVRDYRRLLEVEPHLLADIGLDRDAVRQALRAAERG